MKCERNRCQPTTKTREERNSNSSTRSPLNNRQASSLVIFRLCIYFNGGTVCDPLEHTRVEVLSCLLISKTLMSVESNSALAKRCTRRYGVYVTCSAGHVQTDAISTRTGDTPRPHVLLRLRTSLRRNRCLSPRLVGPLLSHPPPPLLICTR